MRTHAATWGMALVLLFGVEACASILGADFDELHPAAGDASLPATDGPAAGLEASPRDAEPPVLRDGGRDAPTEASAEGGSTCAWHATLSETAARSAGGRLIISADVKPSAARGSGLSIPRVVGDFDAAILVKSFSFAQDNSLVYVGLTLACNDGALRLAVASLKTSGTGVVAAVAAVGENSPPSTPPVDPAGITFRVNRVAGTVTLTVARGATVLVTQAYPAWCPNAPLEPLLSVSHSTTFRAELDDFKSSSCVDDFSVDKTY